MQPELFPYPPVGQIAVTQSGNRIAVWPCETDDPACFSGQLLEEGANWARVAVHNVSNYWRRDVVVRTEAPTENDQRLSVINLMECA